MIIFILHVRLLRGSPLLSGVTESPADIYVIPCILKDILGTALGLQGVYLDQRGRHASGHVCECHHTHQVPVLQSSDEHIEEIDEGELNQGCEHGHEANDNEDIQSCSVANLWLSLPSESNGDHSQHSGGSKLGSSRSFLAFLCLDQPEGDPGAHHDDVQGHVHLQKGEHG